MVKHVILISRVDYYNVFYVGLPLKNIWKIKLVQNATSQAVTGVSYLAHVTPLLCKLHQLPMCFHNSCNSRFWLSPLKLFMPQDQVTYETISPQLFLLVLSEGYAQDTVSQVGQESFLLWHPWNIIPPKIRLSLWAFCKALKTQICTWAWVRAYLLVVIMIS